MLFPGDAGEVLKSGAIATKVGQPGLMLFGLYRNLPGGWYRITLSIGSSADTYLQKAIRPLRVEIVGGLYRIAAKYLTVSDLRQGKVTCLFKMPDSLSLSIVLQPVQIAYFHRWQLAGATDCRAARKGGWFGGAADRHVRAAEKGCGLATDSHA